MGMRADAEQRERRQTVVPDSLVERTLCRGGIRIGAYRLVSLHHALRAYHFIGLYAQRKFAQRLLFHRKKNTIRCFLLYAVCIERSSMVF